MSIGFAPLLLSKSGVYHTFPFFGMPHEVFLSLALFFRLDFIRFLLYHV